MSLKMIKSGKVLEHAFQHVQFVKQEHDLQSRRKCY